MLKNIAVFGAAGFHGLPVVHALLKAGFNVSVLSKDVDKEKEMLPPEVNVVEGNWMYHHDLKRFLSTQDAVYCSLSVDQHELPDDNHSETNGLREIINVSLECGIRRIAYMSSILQYNQVESEDLWWVFQVKKDAVNYIRDCGIPHTIFYPSTFMECFVSTYRKGKAICLHGVSRFPVYFISDKDYARMVAKSFQVLGTDDREYFMQGNNCYNMQEAAQMLVKHSSSEKLKVKTIPDFLMKFYALFDIRWKFKSELAAALNNNNELYISEDTFEELGKPEISFTDFAKQTK
jgi:uncharacterized protein YbjT (DUF2867 family)